MMKLRINFFAETLGMGTSMTVLLPQRASGQPDVHPRPVDRPPVLYLLHGASDDDTQWTRMTSIERYANERGLAVVMPQAHLSFYCDEVNGHKFWTFLSQELPDLIADSFVVSSRREDTFVAGLSMGGYGAFKLALNQPDRFAAAASMSGALNLAAPHWAERDPLLRRRVWGDGQDLPAADDLVGLVQHLDVATLPRLYLACGDQDDLLADTQEFERVARRAGADLDVHYRPGTHTWDYWDAEIQRVLAWLPLR